MPELAPGAKNERHLLDSTHQGQPSLRLAAGRRYLPCNHRDAIDSPTDRTRQIDRTALALSNVPPIFDLLTAKRDAASGVASSAGRTAAGLGPNIHVTINHPPSHLDIVRVAREVKHALIQEARLGGSTDLALALAL